MKARSILFCVFITLFFVPSAFSITINDSSYLTSYYDSPTQNQDYSLYMIGVYETRSDHSSGYHPTGTATVNIGDQYGKNTILVLSSYEPTLWNIIGDGANDLTQILLYGYHDQTISGVATSTPVTEYSYLGTSDYKGFTYSYPGDGRVVSHLESEGFFVSSFAGSYRATDFTISELTPAPVPEPTTFALMFLGLAGVGINKLRTRKRNA